MYRLDCGQANTYNVEQLERMRNDEMTNLQETSEKDNVLQAPEDETDAQDSQTGT